MDFLKERTNEAIKRELRSILDSYHHYWDLLAELLQNSRDAIERAQRSGDTGPHFVQIRIDSASRQIEVLDNGVGIPKEKVAEVLGPGGGDKGDRAEEVGEKGVGLTYAIFSGGSFSIESRANDGQHYGGQVAGARPWLDSAGPDAPPQYTPLKAKQLTNSKDSVEFEGATFPLNSFTHIRIGAIPPSADTQDVFGLTGPQLKFLLKTRTAVGVTSNLFDDDFEPTFRVFYEFQLGGDEPLSKGELTVGYSPPHSYLEKVQSYDDVTAAFVSKSDATARRKFLKDTAVWATKTIKNSAEEIKVYGVMMPGNGVFETLSKGALKLQH